MRDCVDRGYRDSCAKCATERPHREEDAACGALHLPALLQARRVRCEHWICELAWHSPGLLKRKANRVGCLKGPQPVRIEDPNSSPGASIRRSGMLRIRERKT